MLKYRSIRYPDLEHYLQVRKTSRFENKACNRLGIGALGSLFAAAVSELVVHGTPELSLAFLATVPIWTVGMIVSCRQARRSGDQILLRRADEAAKSLRALLPYRRFKTSLHPGMASVLNECAGAWRRIEAANQNRKWQTGSHWYDSRLEWTRAADLAMAEALVLGESSLTLPAPRSPVEQVIEAVVDHFTSVPVQDDQPLPIQFRDTRLIAEQLTRLAREVESIAENLPRGHQGNNPDPAREQLEDVIERLREIKLAEEELRQQSRA